MNLDESIRDHLSKRGSLALATDRIKKFHRAFSHPCPDSPSLGSPELQALRDKLIAEEFEEYREAIRKNDIIGVADGLGDLLVVVLGAAVAYGIPINQVWEEICDSNMSKLGADNKPILREDGKILKGPNYFKANLHQFFEDRMIQ